MPLHYRTSIVRQNINASFPDASEETKNKIFNHFYVFVGKILREMIFPITPSYLDKHYTYTESEEVSKWVGSDKNILITMAHLANWEVIGSGIGYHFPNMVTCFYRRIKNKFLDRILVKRRSGFLKHLLESRQVSELIRILRNEQTYLMQIIDQNPGSDQGLLWTSFLGRPTAFSNASETLAMRYKMPVVYAHVRIEDNGNYIVNLRPIWDGVSSVEPGEITRRYARCLEDNIREIPYAWLWTHRRWKRKPPDSINP